MGIEKMSLVTVEGKVEQLDNALMLCCKSGDFHIKESTIKSENISTAQNPYSAVYQRIRSIADSLGIAPEFRSTGDFGSNPLGELTRWADSVESEVKKTHEEIADLADSIEELQQTDACVKHLHGLNVRFADLMNMKYTRFRVGRLPAESLEKLEYITNRCIHFIPFDKGSDYVWGLYVTPADYKDFADSLMNSLYFERIELPDYLDECPDKTDEMLNKAIADEAALKARLEDSLKKYRNQHKEEILLMLCRAKFLAECCDLRKFALVSGGRFSFSGYCPSKHAAGLAGQLEALDSVQTVKLPVKNKDAAADVPVKLKNNAVVRPFEMFVKMYGLPSYGGFDPTPYVAFTYCLMFGIMFGDLGQGLLVSLLGLVLTKFTKNGLAPIMIRIGLFSAAFGVLYGSVFGIETIITPFFHRENIWRFLGYAERPESIFQVATTLLLVALGIGIILIMISMLFNIVLNFRKKKFGEALFGVNGIAGLVFYASLVIAVGGMFMLGIDLFNPAYIILLIVLPLCLIFFKHPLSDLVMGVRRTEKVSVGNFIIENFIELFEAALSFLSNTMSYLRIGGFILSHAGMMLVVAQLAGTNQPGAEITAGTVIIYIVGNLFVMGIEGLLVGIQVLRLEFYEIFNRFYDGSGQPFRPIEINFSE